MELDKILEMVKTGGIPKGLEDKLTLVKSIEKIAYLEVNLVAQILTTARIEDFNNDEPQWQSWVTEQFGYSKEHRCHLNLIGKMLCGMRTAYPECYERLFELDGEKNLAIAALYRNESGKKVSDFLRAWHVEKMSREEIRNAVNDCLGIKKQNPFKVEQPELPGFQQGIVNIYNSLGKINPTELIKSYNPETAIKTVSVGMNCLNVASSYYSKSGEYKNLSAEELNKLEAYAQKLYKQFGSWREVVCAKDMKNAG